MCGPREPTKHFGISSGGSHSSGECRVSVVGSGCSARPECEGNAAALVPAAAPSAAPGSWHGRSCSTRMGLLGLGGCVSAGVGMYLAHSSCANLGVCTQICMGSCVHICMFTSICVCLHMSVHGQAGDACSGVIQRKKDWNTHIHTHPPVWLLCTCEHKVRGKGLSGASSITHITMPVGMRWADPSLHPVPSGLSGVVLSDGTSSEHRRVRSRCYLIL